MGVQPGDSRLLVAGEMAGDQGGEALGTDRLHVLATVPVKCLPAALRAHAAGLARPAVRRKPPIGRGG